MTYTVMVPKLFFCMPLKNECLSNQEQLLIWGLQFYSLTSFALRCPFVIPCSASLLVLCSSAMIPLSYTYRILMLSFHHSCRLSFFHFSFSAQFLPLILLCLFMLTLLSCFPCFLFHTHMLCPRSWRVFIPSSTLLQVFYCSQLHLDTPLHPFQC